MVTISSGIDQHIESLRFEEAGFRTDQPQTRFQRRIATGQGQLASTPRECGVMANSQDFLMKTVVYLLIYIDQFPATMEVTKGYFSMTI